MIDIDILRDQQKLAHGLSKIDIAYTFYHDETNNIKKLRVNDTGFNIAEPAVFILGGVVHEGSARPLDIEPLRKAMRVQQSADEIKLKHVAKGDFLSLLNSDKLTTFLEWVLDSDLVVHYHALDPLYWSLVDIVDSILYGVGEPSLFPMHAQLKADLTTLIRAATPETASLLFHYKYPDVSPEEQCLFLNELLGILEKNNNVLPEFNANMLKGLLQAGRNLHSLTFIEGFTPHVLIETFNTFYVNRISLFKYSNHIVDMEDTIRDEIDAIELVSNGKAVINYRFADSESEFGIQVSDIVVGLLGKMHTYFSQTPRDVVANDRNALQNTSLRNAEILRDLIDASHAENIAFLHHVSSASDIDKMNLFLRNRGSSYEA